jgi:hypothetical protein
MAVSTESKTKGFSLIKTPHEKFSSKVYTKEGEKSIRWLSGRKKGFEFFFVPVFDTDDLVATFFPMEDHDL